MLSDLRNAIAVIAIGLAVGACKSVPSEPPMLEVPAPTLTQPLDLERWWTLFDDASLARLVDEALGNNLDLRIAMARIDQARANVLLARADLYPSVNLEVGAGRNRVSEVGSQPFGGGFDPTSSNHRVAVVASYELDVWGKFRASAQAAQNQLLATRYARETVRSTVAAEVARTYFALLAADAELALLRDTLTTRSESVALQRDRFEGGVIGALDLRQAESERAAVLADIARAQRAIELFESALAALTGRSPREVFAPLVTRDTLTQRLLDVPAIAAGLPSGLLDRRPDLRRVEAELVAANLRIDVARADYYPAISLTALFGSESAALKNLFSGPALIWSVAGALAQPLVGIRAVDANVDLQTARRNEVLATYVQTVQTAFREAHDALVANRTFRDALDAQRLRREALAEALELADLRYKAGYSGYLEVLDAQRQLLLADTLRIAAARDARIALVDLSRALGGGWSAESVERTGMR